MSFACGAGQIHSRQQDEDIRLDKRNSNMQSDEDDGYRDRDQGNEHQNDHVARKHVSVQTNCERQDAREMADNLQRKHQNCKRRASAPMHALHWRAGEVRDVFKPGLPEAVRLVIDENADRAPERNHIVSGRRFESWNQTPEVGYEDEQAQSHQKRCKPLAVMADDLSALALDETVQSL